MKIEVGDTIRVEVAYHDGDGVIRWMAKEHEVIAMDGEHPVIAEPVGGELFHRVINKEAVKGLRKAI